MRFATGSFKVQKQITILQPLVYSSPADELLCCSFSVASQRYGDERVKSTFLSSLLAFSAYKSQET